MGLRAQLHFRFTTDSPDKDLSMSSLLQIEANRRNSRKSTGPRSVEGKVVSRMNALKSGIDARSNFIRGENPSDLQGLTNFYYKECQPASVRSSFASISSSAMTGSSAAWSASTPNFGNTTSKATPHPSPAPNSAAHGIMAPRPSSASSAARMTSSAPASSPARN